MLLKTNLHLHTADDPKDKISYSIYQAIDHAQKKGFNVLALTCHKKYAYKKEYADYATTKNILLIPGIEASIEKRDVLILNCDKNIEKIKTFPELKLYKKNNPQIFIIAPHPFVPYLPPKSLGKKLLENIDLFDAIEITVFSNSLFNFNKKAVKIAEKYHKPFIATSDTHFLKGLDYGFSLIEIPTPQEKIPPDLNIKIIFSAIQGKKFKNKTTPLNPLLLLEFIIKATYRTSSHCNIFNSGSITGVKTGGL